jgi:hypothetical protein
VKPGNVILIKLSKTGVVSLINMASTPPGAQKMRIDYNIDKKVYDDFAKNCSRKGFAPQVIVEKLMNKFNETGQI